jgi:hypothetical protein
MMDENQKKKIRRSSIKLCKSMTSAYLQACSDELCETINEPNNNYQVINNTTVFNEASTDAILHGATSSLQNFEESFVSDERITLNYEPLFLEDGFYHNFNSSNSESSSRSDDSDSDTFRNSMISNNLSTILFSWYQRNCIAKSALTDLLQSLKDTTFAEFKLLPGSAITLIKNCLNCNASLTQIVSTTEENGHYVYFGIQNMLNKCFQQPIGACIFENTISLFVNVDGLNILKSENKSIWTITVKIPDLARSPFLVGFFFGFNKPNINSFLDNVCDEIVKLKSEGLLIGGEHFNIKHVLFICDAPARSLIKCIKNHTGYFSCERCEIEGEYVHDARTMVFDEYNCTLRTDTSFRQKLNEEHHHAGVVSPILKLIDFDVIKCFILDYMHLVCLGSFRRLLYFWLRNGPVEYRLSGQMLNYLNSCILSTQQWITSDFSRKCRTLNHLDRLKATELRELLLYRGVICFPKVLSSPALKNYMLLHVGIFILCSPSLIRSQEILAFAKECLSTFVRHSVSLFGRKYCTYNIHNLLHICDDVTNFNYPFDEISSFPFENFFIRLKRIIKSPYLLHEQIINRTLDNSLHHGLFEHFDQSIKFSRSQCIYVPRAYEDFSQYEVVFIHAVRFSIEPPDCFFSNSRGDLFVIKHIVSRFAISGFLANMISNLQTLYNYPCDSCLLKIYKAVIPTNSSLVFIPFQEIYTKYMAIPLSNNTTGNSVCEFGFFPLNYTASNFL